MEYLKKIFLGKKVPFYVSLFCSVIILVAAIMYATYFLASERETMKDFVSWLVPVLPAIGVVLFLGLTLLKQSRIGTAVLSASAFAGFVVYVTTVFGFVVENIMNSIPEMKMIIACAAMLFVGFVTTNVTAWLKHE